MSRGGRFGKAALFKGATWDVDTTIKLDDKPSELYPPVPDLPLARALTRADKRIILNSKALRKAIHQGPLYTESKKPDPFQTKKIYGEEQRNASYETNAKPNAAEFDPFMSGVPTYSMKYTRTKRTIPQLTGRPFNKELFPPELHATLEGKSGSRKRRLMLAQTPEEIKAEEELRRKRVLEKFDDIGDEEVGEQQADEDGFGEEEEQDNDFSADDDDMGGDYDAEKYFDDESEKGEEDNLEGDAF